ncbi:MAG: putative glycine oxidase precursor [Gemmatimonadetes bacterium]|nr:putative glycine oxidase precursor [Gemmatimonadota bacterium]
MSRTTDLVVVGGGIAGLTVALAASERGLSVVVIDEPRTGAASRAAAGMLAPSVEGLPAAVRALALEAREYFPRFLAELRAKADVDVAVALNRSGILEVASSDEELALLHARASDAAEPLDRRALAQLEPALGSHAGALLHAFDGSVDNITLMTTLDLAVARDRLIRRIHGSVDSVELTGGRHIAWTGEGTRHEGKVLVLATGAWASGIPGLPRTLPVRPLRGQLLRLDQLPVTHVAYVAGGYLVPRGTTLLVGATSEEAGFKNAVTGEGQMELLGIAQRAVPELASARVVEHWAGLRPVTPDALPILGRDPDFPGLIYACGFSRNGILLAPWASGQLAMLITGGSVDLTPFSPSRFA